MVGEYVADSGVTIGSIMMLAWWCLLVTAWALDGACRQKRRCTVETCRLETQCKQRKKSMVGNMVERHVIVMFCFFFFTLFTLFKVGKQKINLEMHGMKWNQETIPSCLPSPSMIILLPFSLLFSMSIFSFSFPPPFSVVSPQKSSFF